MAFGLLGQEARQRLQEVARRRILDGEHGRAVGDEDRGQHAAKVAVRRERIKCMYLDRSEIARSDHFAGMASNRYLCSWRY